MAIEDRLNHEAGIVVGRIVRPHGIRGAVRVRLYWEDSGALLDVERVWLQAPESGQAAGEGAPPAGSTCPPLSKLRECRVVSVSLTPGAALISLDGVTSRDEAEDLRDWDVWVLRQDLPDMADDEFYYCDLPGFAVEREDGVDLGVVADVFGTQANDVLVVQTSDGGELLVPMVEGIVLQLDKAGRRIVVGKVKGVTWEDVSDAGEEER